MKRIIIVLILLSFISLPRLVWAAASESVSSSNSQANTTVAIQNFQFSPQTVHINSGTTLTWINHDSTSHTVTADDMNAAETWDSGPITPGQSYSKTFTKPGIYTYHCSIHPNMKGTIQVVAQSTTVGVGGGPPSPSPVASNPSQLPATGVPMEAYPLIGLIPFGLKLINFKKVKTEKETAQTIWDKRQMKI